jgi:hypothetical protein
MILFYNTKALLFKFSLIFIILTAYSLEGFSMSFLTKPEEEVVFSSPMEGNITFGNKPVSGAIIERLIKWKDKTGEIDATTTDENGNFHLPIIKDTVKLPKISQFVVTEEIFVIYNNKKHLIWSLSKMTKKIYGELGGKPKNLRCELTDEDEPFRFDNAMLVSICKWDSIEPQKGE